MDTEAWLDMQMTKYISESHVYGGKAQRLLRIAFGIGIESESQRERERERKRENERKKKKKKKGPAGLQYDTDQ